MKMQDFEFWRVLFAGAFFGVGLSSVMWMVAWALVVNPVHAEGEKVQTVKISGPIEVKIIGPVSNGKPIRIEQVK